MPSIHKRLTAPLLLMLLLCIFPIHAQVLVGPSHFVVGPSGKQLSIHDGIAQGAPTLENAGGRNITMSPLNTRSVPLVPSGDKTQQRGQKLNHASFNPATANSTASTLNNTSMPAPFAMQRSIRAQSGKTLLPILSLLLDDDTTAETVRTVGEFDFFSTTACCKFGIGGFTLGDFNGDGLVDALFAGRATQPTTQAEWINSRVQVILQKPGGGFEIATDVLTPTEN
jgi:hypothetical protein